MNTGQMLITIAALMLLSMVILRTNSSFLYTSVYLMDSKFGVLAVSIATSVIEEASSKSFDENTSSSAVSNTGQLTDVNLIGPESGEYYEIYDDFDDFDGYVKIDSTMPSAPFNISCAVCYVRETFPDVPYNGKTWHKKITVTVSSEYMPDTVTISSVYSYWFFR